ncbi:MAG: hypothetical protein QXS20_04485 [Candidatus Thorarchaeota archaeon]
MFQEENASVSVTPHKIASVIRDAYEFYSQRNVDEKYATVALDLIRRYVQQEGIPRESEPMYGAALYIVSRHPWTYPNPVTKAEFAAKLSMKESSLDWYTENMVERLGFLGIHDRTRQKFFIDPQGIVASVLESVVRGSVGEEVVRSIVRGVPLSSAELAEMIVEKICHVVKIVPASFEDDLMTVVQKMIEVESRRLSREMANKGD